MNPICQKAIQIYVEYCKIVQSSSSEFSIWFDTIAPLAPLVELKRMLGPLVK